MLIKEYETLEEAKTFKFMKLVFSHTKEGEDVSKKRVCDAHGTHESTMQTFALCFVLNLPEVLTGC